MRVSDGGWVQSSEVIVFGVLGMKIPLIFKCVNLSAEDSKQKKSPVFAGSFLFFSLFLRWARGDSNPHSFYRASS